ncbi:ubiquitin-conjugating enzyme/RWD-like protein [Pholiota molesta]|nr:ubiquitin-conjugating enzyme/RWD-like protein [Pholiota molesta]
MSVPPAVMRRGIRIQMNDEDMLDVTGIIAGPEGTPYAGGYFRVKFRFTEEFPAAPPKYISPKRRGNGEICVNTLKKDWKSSYGIGHILVTVKCLLIYPNPESALDEEAGKLLLEDYSSYCARAKLITSVHATPRVKPVEFNKPSANEVESSTPTTEKDSSKPADASAPTPVASTSKLVSPTPATTTLLSPPSLATSISSIPIVAPYIMPVITRKSSSPAPPMSLKASLSSDKEGLSVGPQKERHPSPSPLGTADANVGGGKPGMGVGIGMASTAGMNGVTGTKAVKRAATGSGVSGAEKRKKALKRL